MQQVAGGGHIRYGGGHGVGSDHGDERVGGIDQQQKVVAGVAVVKASRPEGLGATWPLVE
jgi:hypothetical protein